MKTGSATVSVHLLVAWMLLLRPAASNATELGLSGSSFTLDGHPTFLLGASYYGALGASDDFIVRDLDDLRRHGFPTP